MKQSERDEIYKKFIDAWGLDAQIRMCIEEMSELTKELCKFQRYGGEKGDTADIKLNIIEEVADVYNTVDQMALFFGREEVEKVRDAKIARGAKRLE